MDKKPEKLLDQVRRHHLHPNAVQKAVKRTAQQSGIPTAHLPSLFCRSYTTHLLEAGYNIRSVQELPGHKDVKTAMITTHVLNRGTKAVRSPLNSRSYYS